MGCRGGKLDQVVDWRGSGAGWFCSVVGVSTVCTGIEGMVEKQGPGIRDWGIGNTWVLGERFCCVQVACQAGPFD